MHIVAIKKFKIAINTFLGCFHLETFKFSDWKRAIFRCGKEIKGLRGDVVLYVAQASPQIDTATAEKGRFRMKTRLETIYLMTEKI